MTIYDNEDSLRNTTSCKKKSPFKMDVFNTCWIIIATTSIFFLYDKNKNPGPKKLQVAKYTCITTADTLWFNFGVFSDRNA